MRFQRRHFRFPTVGNRVQIVARQEHILEAPIPDSNVSWGSKSKWDNNSDTSWGSNLDRFVSDGCIYFVRLYNAFSRESSIENWTSVIVWFCCAYYAAHMLYFLSHAFCAHIAHLALCCFVFTHVVFLASFICLCTAFLACIYGHCVLYTCTCAYIVVTSVVVH